MKNISYLDQSKNAVVGFFVVVVVFGFVVFLKAQPLFAGVLFRSLKSGNI